MRLASLGWLTADVTPLVAPAGGALSGKYLGDEAPKGARFTLFPGYMERYNKSLARTAAGEYVAVAKKYGMTATQLALAWCRSRCVWGGGGKKYGMTATQLALAWCRSRWGGGGAARRQQAGVSLAAGPARRDLSGLGCAGRGAGTLPGVGSWYMAVPRTTHGMLPPTMGVCVWRRVRAGGL